MENWKRALLVGAASASAIMFLKRKPAAGIILAGVGLATVASEYPEKFAAVREKLPDYLDRGTALVDVVSRLGERLADAAGTRKSRWYDPFLRG